MILHHEDIKGVILSATSGDPGLLRRIGYLIASWECKKKGIKHRSKLLTRLSFGNFNREFRPNRTEFDWLSRDDSEVDKYIADPFCGGTFTAGFFRDILYGIGEINKRDNIEKIPKDLPIFVISGEKDPMGKKTKSVKQVIHDFHKAGISRVSSKFYTGARHELLNETNREEVIQDIVTWLQEQITE